MPSGPKKDTARQERAFEIYYGLGPGRSYPAVARECGVSIATVKSWGRRHGWQARVQERDLEVARAAADRTLQADTEAAKQQMRIVRMAPFHVAKQITEGKVKATMADLDRLIRLERFLANEPDSRTEHVVGDLSGRTREELETMLAEELCLLGKLGLRSKVRRGDSPKRIARENGREGEG